jgi:tetratricopeptide (TPR) repeat protein
MQTFDRFEIRLNLAPLDGEDEEFVVGEIYFAEIYINDRSLIDIVREIEEPYVRSEIEKARAAGEDRRDYSGEYSYLRAKSVLLPSRSLLDEPDDLQRGSMVLGCPCGVPSCWCIRVRIALTDSTVEWSNFRHDFRDWEYNLGFRFERDQYLAELSKEISHTDPVTFPSYDRQIELNPNNADTYIERGFAKYRFENYQGAITDYDRAIELNPNNIDTYFKRGAAKESLGDYQGAISDYERASELEPNNTSAYCNRGSAKESLGDNQGAIIDYDKAIELDPNDDYAYYLRGRAKSNLGDEHAAIIDYDRAIELNPNDVFSDTYFNRGQAKSKLGNKQEAIADLIIASELFYERNAIDLHNETRDLIRKLQEK